jgi:hypothetical protein
VAIAVAPGLTFEQLASALPPPRPRASPRRQAVVLEAVLREEVAAGRVEQQGGGRFVLARERFPAAVVAALERLDLHD